MYKREFYAGVYVPGMENRTPEEISKANLMHEKNMDKKKLERRQRKREARRQRERENVKA